MCILLRLFWQGVGIKSGFNKIGGYMNIGLHNLFKNRLRLVNKKSGLFLYCAWLALSFDKIGCA